MSTDLLHATHEHPDGKLTDDQAVRVSAYSGGPIGVDAETLSILGGMVKDALTGAAVALVGRWRRHAERPLEEANVVESTISPVSLEQQD